VRVWDAASGQELLSVKGPTGWVDGVAFSPDGRRLASPGDDNTVRVWDAATGQELLTLKGHRGKVDGVAFSPDGRWLASWGDATVRVWDAAGGQALRTLQGQTTISIYTMPSAPDGRRVDFISPNSFITLPAFVSGVALSPDGRRLAGRGNDKTVRIWDAVDGKELFALKGHTGGVLGVAYSPDGRRLALAGGDKTVRVWDATGGQESLPLGGHTGEVFGVAFSPDGRRLASASEDTTVRIWDAADGRELLALKGHTNRVLSVAYSPDGRRLASTGQDGKVRVWDAAGGRELLALNGRAWHVAYSPDGRRLALAGGDKTVRVWDATGGQELLVLRGHTGPVHGVAFSPDGRRLASASDDTTVRVWDAASGQELLSLKGHSGSVWGVVFSPDGRRLASASLDRTVRVWEGPPVPPEVWRRRGLVSDVRTLFTTLPLREEVLAALRKDPTLTEADRDFAFQVAQTHEEDAEALNGAAWAVIKGRDAGKEAYAAALRRAEAAARLAPGNGNVLNTLGIAHYRLGDYARALETLEKSANLNAAKGPPVTDLAFLAMAHQHLGHKEQARATLDRLREVMKQPGWEKNAEAQGFLREAEGLIDGKAGDKKE
jgi:DNA-binding beta-propeller fold protein YncE